MTTADYLGALVEALAAGPCAPTSCSTSRVCAAPGPTNSLVSSQRESPPGESLSMAAHALGHEPVSTIPLDVE
jgi:hypothetical protein